jgi:hypothetical protein
MFFFIFPILLLITAIGSILWYQRTTNDIFYALAVSSAIIGLIWSLAIAHWSVLLLGLLVLLKFPSPVLSVIQIHSDR